MSISNKRDYWQNYWEISLFSQCAWVVFVERGKNHYEQLS